VAGGFAGLAAVAFGAGLFPYTDRYLFWRDDNLAISIDNRIRPQNDLMWPAGIGPITFLMFPMGGMQSEESLFTRTSHTTTFEAWRTYKPGEIAGLLKARGSYNQNRPL